MLSLLRLEYLPPIIIAALLGIYMANGSLLAAFPTLVGWCFLSIGQNLLNDYFERDRKIPVSPKGLMTLFIMSTAFGLFLFPLESLLLPVLFTILIAMYSYRVKRIPFGSIIIQVVAGVLVIIFYSSNINLEVLAAVSVGAATFQLIHEIVHREAIYSLLKERSVTLARVMCVATVLMFAYNYLLLNSIMFIAAILLFLIVGVRLHKGKYSKDARVIGCCAIIFLTFMLVAYMVGLGMV